MNQPMNAGGYIPSWGESKPVGYHPGEDDTDNARCECGRFIPCRRCPTPIDPADIRPGDVVERREVMTVRDIEDELMETTRGLSWCLDDGDATWHLVHRPDPDAEAVEALLTAGLTDDANLIESDTARIARRYLANLREQGWDVTRRQP